MGFQRGKVEKLEESGGGEKIEAKSKAPCASRTRGSQLQFCPRPVFSLGLRVFVVLSSRTQSLHSFVQRQIVFRGKWFIWSPRHNAVANMGVPAELLS